MSLRPSVLAGVTCAVGIGLLLMLGFGTVSLCQAEPECGLSCQDDCYRHFYAIWGGLSLALAALTVVAVRLLGARAWLVPAVGTVVAGIALAALS